MVQEKGASEYVVTGGFAELGETVSVLAEKAVLKADFDREMFDELVTAAQTALDSARAIWLAMQLIWHQNLYPILISWVKT